MQGSHNPAEQVLRLWRLSVMAENTARDFAEKGTAYARDTLEKSKAAVEETQKVMGQAYTTASKGAVDFNLHLLEAAQANMNAAFDFARQLARVTSPTEFFELSAAHTRKQLETFTEQTKQLTTLAQKAVADPAHPFQTGAATAFNQAFSKRS
jgi:phasin